MSKTRLKLAKYQPKAKQDPEVELLLSESYSLSSFTLSLKTEILYKMYKSKCVYFNKII